MEEKKVVSFRTFACFSVYVFLKWFEFLQRFLYRTENGTHRTQYNEKNSTSKIATKKPNENERKITLRRPDVRLLLDDFHHFSFAPLHFVEDFFLALSQHTIYCQMNKQKKSSTHRHALTVHRDEKKKKKTFHIELLYFAKCCKISHTIIIFIWRVLCETAAFNELTDENSAHRANKITHHDWTKKEKMMRERERENEKCSLALRQYY